jgi:hypothetical protein
LFSTRSPWGRARDSHLPAHPLGQRERSIADDDLVFVGDWGGHVTPVRRRMIAQADIRRVPEWMGVQTAMEYLHYAAREEDAALVAEAFRTDDPAVPTG